MSDKIRKELERWLRQQLFRKRDQPLSHFLLRSGSSRGGEIDIVDIPSEVDGDNVGILLDDILAKLQSDADSMGSKVQRYIVVACELGSKTGPRHALRIRGEGEEDDESDADNAPTEKNLTGQLMRHNEALMRMLVMTTGTQVNAMSRRLDSQEKVVERMFEERVRDKEAVEASKSLQHDRDMQMLITSGQEDRKNEMLKKVEALVPVVINKLTGKEMLPDNPESNVVRTLLKTFTPEQLQAMAPLLSHEQQVMLMLLIKEINNPPKGTPS